MNIKPQQPLYKAMLSPSFYPHAVQEIERIDTHISTLFLTGEFVYKLKKPVDLGFLDFSRLEDRKHFCEEEIRLNKRTAPDLYLEVVPIYQQGDEYSLHPGGEVIEYAVKMRQFDHSQQLDLLIASQTLQIDSMNDLAVQIADLHQKAAAATHADNWGEPETLLAPCKENFTALSDVSSADREMIDLLYDWTMQQAGLLNANFLSRKAAAKVRECHGDMHLANIAVIDHQITLFDCIEFSKKLHWIDVISDLAFVLMDLENCDHPNFASRLLNQYLVITGDYDGLQVLNFYKVYRAMVRAKVAYLQQQTESMRHYLQLAMSYTYKNQPRLFITFGFSGSGKSWNSEKIADQLGYLHIRSDVERKRLHGMQTLQRQQTSVGEGIYSTASSEQTYQRLYELAETILKSGFSVIVDATFLKAKQRNKFKELAKECQCPFSILHFSASQQQLGKNIRLREQRNDDASDANIAILHQQLRHYDPLDRSESVIEIPFGSILPIERISQSKVLKI